MPTSNSADELAKLHGLLKDGIISQKEFDTVKKRIVSGGGQPDTGKKRAAQPSPPPQKKPRSAKKVLLICAIIFAALWGLGSLGDISEDTDDQETLSIPTSTTESRSQTMTQPGGGDTITVQGEVLIMQDANFTISGDTCTGVGIFAGVTGGATVTVTTDGKHVTAQLADGVLSPEGNCLLAFTIEMYEGDPFLVEVGGLSGLKRGTTIGTYNDGTRWMSVGFD